MNESLYFNASRLVEARTARGWSITFLAELSGIKKQSISNYENGKQIPRAENLLTLSTCLNVPLHFFQKQSIQCSEKHIFFRSRKGLAKKEWDRAKIRLKWFEELLFYFSEFVEFVPLNIPDQFDVSNRLGKVSDADIEEIAAECREYWGLGRGPISNIMRLLENNGIIVIKISSLDVKEEDAFSQWLFDESLPVAVMVAENPSTCRDRFSLAHELGHIILHKNVVVNDENFDIIEQQANLFASAFLMPAASYPKEFKFPNLEIFKLLKERWKVSIKAQIYRCKQLGLVNDNTAKNLYINIARRKWLTREPLDDTIPAEENKVIKRIMKLMLDDLKLSIEDISGQTGFSITDIAQLCEVDISSNKERQELLNLPNSKILPFHS